MTTQRTFRSSRRVRVGDCDARGIVRVDALARYLQDIGYDDTDDIGVGDGGLWVARSITMTFPSAQCWPVRNEIIQLETYCGGVGRAFAQRNVEIETSAGEKIHTTTLWVSVNEAGKPIGVPQWLLDAYPDAKKVTSSRTLSVALPTDGVLAEHPWHLRASDFDINDHANNTVAFDALYEVAHVITAPLPLQVVIEYHQPIETADLTKLIYYVNDYGFQAWLVSNGIVAAAMQWKYS